MKEIKYCSVCGVKLSFMTKPGLGSGKLMDGGRVCRKCFKIIVKENVDFGLKSKMKYTIDMVKNIVENYNNPIKNRPIPENPKPVSISEKETLEKTDYIPDENNININGLVFIEYTDAQGFKSNRRITIISAKPYNNNDFFISAYCHEKEAHRTFKMSNIDVLIDLETGEIIENIESFFFDRYNNSPLGQITKCYQKFECEILILTFVARADGVLRKKERDIINNFITENCSEELDMKILDNEIRRTYCDSIEFRKNLKIMKLKSEKEKQNILDLVINIINTDKNIDPMESGSLELIKKELKIK